MARVLAVREDVVVVQRMPVVVVPAVRPPLAEPALVVPVVGARVGGAPFRSSAGAETHAAGVERRQFILQAREGVLESTYLGFTLL